MLHLLSFLHTGIRKLDNKSEKCILVGYCLESKEYKLYNPLTCKVIESRNVVFHEGSRWKWEINNQDVQEVPIKDVMGDPDILGKDATRREEDRREAGGTIATPKVSPIRLSPQITSTDGSPARKTRSLEEIYNTCTHAQHVAKPVDFKKAMKMKDWQATMDAEMVSIVSNNTWELCHLPPGKHAIGLKWIYKTK